MLERQLMMLERAILSPLRGQLLWKRSLKGGDGAPGCASPKGCIVNKTTI